MREAEFATPENRRISRAVLVTGALTDCALAAAKGVGGWLAASPALISDAIHSLADIVVSAVAIGANRLAVAAPDADHPHGHGRFDSLASLAISAVLVATGTQLGWSSVQAIGDALEGVAATPFSIFAAAPPAALDATTASTLAAAICVGSVAMKEVVYRWTMSVGLRLRSQTMIANAWHHRADSLSSIVALVGIGGAALGVPVLDPVAALVVAGMVGKAGIDIGGAAVKELLDTRLDDDIIALAVDEARSLDDVAGVRRVRARRMGPAVVLDLELAVAPTITVAASAQLAHTIRSAVYRERREVSEMLIHFVPADPSDDKGLPGYRPPIRRAADHDDDHGHGHGHGHDDGHAHEHGHGHDHGHAHDASSGAAAGSPAPATVAAAAAQHSMLQLTDLAKTHLLAVPGVKAVTQCDVHAEASTSRLLHVHAAIVVPMHLPVREALGIVRAARATLAAATFPVAAHAVGAPLPGGEGGQGGGDVWSVSQADVELESAPL